MGRLLGLMLFCIGIGMVIGMLIEENVIIGGFGEQVIDYVSRSGLDVHVRNIGIPDDYVEHGNVDLLRKEVGLDRDTIIAQVLEDLGRESRQITEKDR